MFHRFTSIIIATALFATPAMAEINTQRYANLANVQCEDKQTIADMEEIWKDMTYKSGRRVTSVQGQARVTASKTRRKTANSLACSVTIKYRYRGGSKRTRGLFSLRFFPNGKWTVKFQPGY